MCYFMHTYTHLPPPLPLPSLKPYSRHCRRIDNLFNNSVGKQLANWTFKRLTHFQFHAFYGVIVSSSLLLIFFLMKHALSLTSTIVLMPEQFNYRCLHIANRFQRLQFDLNKSFNSDYICHIPNEIRAKKNCTPFPIVGSSNLMQ